MAISYTGVVWGGGKLSAVCVLHCGLWICLKSTYWADSLPQSKSRQICPNTLPSPTWRSWTHSKRTAKSPLQGSA